MRPRPSATCIASNRGAALAVAVAIYAASAIWVTWPMPQHPTEMLYGSGGDVLGAVAEMRETAQHAFPFWPGTIGSLAAPEGLPVRFPLYVATWPSSGLLYVLTLALGAVAAMNIFVLAGLIATASAGFLLIRRLTGSPGLALIFGWVLAFAPSSLFNAGSAPDFAHVWVLVLLIWRMLVLREDPTRRNGLLAAAAGILAVSWNPYYLLIGTVTAVAMGLSNVALRHRDAPRQVRALGWALGPLALLLTVYVAIASGASRSGVRSHPLSELYVYSLRPTEFLRPPPDSRIFGGLDPPGIRDAAVTYAYVGLFVAALAVWAAICAIRRAATRSDEADTPPGTGAGTRDALSLLVLAAVGLVWAAPPTARIGRVTIYLPSWFVFHVTSTWRIYGRFGILVLTAVVLLASVGAWDLLRRLPRAGRPLAIAGIGCLVILDIQSPGPGTTTLVPPPPVYAVLRGLPPGGLAEYPLVPAAFADYGILFRQDVHGRRLLNGYESGSPEEKRALGLARLTSKTAQSLRRLGVRFVIVDSSRPAPAPDLLPGTPDRQFHLIWEQGAVRLFRID